MKNIAKLLLFLTVLCFTSCENPTSGNNETGKSGTLFVYAGTVSSLEIKNDSRGYTFPDTFLNQSNEVSITIKNIGDGMINLTGKPYINLDGATTVFSISAQPESSTINPEKSISFKLKFSPVNATESYVYVSIPNDSKNEPDFSFTIYGTGIRPKPIASIIFNNEKKLQNETIDSGDVLLSLSTDINVTIKNDGQLPLEIDPAGITITGTDAAVFTITRSPNAIIQPESTSFITINCKPVKLGENKAVLTIPTNDASRNPAVVNLKVTGVRGTPILALTQGANTITDNTLTPVDFGIVEISSYNSLLFTITNKGDIPLELTGDPVVESSNAVFTISSQPANKIIDTNGSVSFMIRFIPSTEGEVTGKISIANNTSTGEFAFPVKGTGYVKKPQITISYNDDIVPQNGTIDAGDVLFSLSKNITVTIKNTGEMPLTIVPADITITGADATAFTRITSPDVSIQAGNESTFIIKCEPVKMGENDAVLTIPSNDSSRTVIIILRVTGVQGVPILELSQDTTVISNNALSPFDFGKILLGSSKSLTFTIKNNGNINLVLSGDPIITSSIGAFTVLAQPANTTILPGSSTEFAIGYTPSGEGVDSGYLTILSNSGGAFTLNVKGTGYTKKPQITIKQGETTILPYNEFNFGTLTPGSTKDITFIIQNTGEDNLTFITVNSNRVNLNDNAAGRFSVTLQPIASTIVTPGNSTDFSIRFSPTATGVTNTATIIIKSNSENDEEFAFRIRGRGGYKIGDTGPGGGIIFYAIDDEFKECTKTELGSSKYYFTEAKNMAENYQGGGFTDWRLPDITELNSMYQNLHRNNPPLGVFITTSYNNYWSSTTLAGAAIAILSFADGSQSHSQVQGYSYNLVRAVRFFTF
ncbi:MAG: choice-of-anchor D domain-containing protein [Treponema sp.]|jgi:hypothetical protein|nr:choice-of-anchor D domain-containing protein [Treponema sp.]